MGRARSKFIKPTTETSFPLASAATIKARWVCEQARQQLNEELGRSLRDDRQRLPPAKSPRRTTAVKRNQRPTALTDFSGRPPPHRRITNVRIAENGLADRRRE
jgi:hypothetical protein